MYWSSKSNKPQRISGIISQFYWMQTSTTHSKELIERAFILGIASADSKRAKKAKKHKRCENTEPHRAHQCNKVEVIEKNPSENLSWQFPHKSFSGDSDVLPYEVSIFLSEINMNIK